jgi:site-specific recombinase XerD
MTSTPLPTPFTATLESFIRSLVAKNRTPATLTGYRSDVGNFLSWLCDTTPCGHPQEVTRADATEYLAERGQAGVSGLSRARNLAAIKEYFRYLVEAGMLTSSPVEGIIPPKREKRGRNYLSQEAYTRLLQLAAGTPRDYAILQVFLQTGIRVSELAYLTIDDVDLDRSMLRVTGKGMADRDIPLNKKATAALRLWLSARRPTEHRVLFTNRFDAPMGVRSIQKLVERYRTGAGIEKRITPHSLRHTFATHKARQGVNAFQLRDYLGHATVATTQLYVHLGQDEARKVMEATSL